MVSKPPSLTRLEIFFSSMSTGCNPPFSESVGSNSTCSLPLITINTLSQLPYKLTSSNYPSWHATFLTILIGYDLMKYLDGTLQCPPTPDANSSTSAVALHAYWNRQDQLLLNAIFGSVSKVVMSLIAMTTTSRDAWQHLAHLFASKSRARIM